MPARSESETICKAVIQSLKDERLRRELSMNRVAHDAGLSQQMVSYVERGIRMPTLDTVVRIAHALEVDLGAIISKATKKKALKSKT